MTVEANQVGQSAALRVDLFQGQGRFHSSWRCGGAEVSLVVERAVNAWDDFQRKRAELVVLSTADGHQLFFGNAVGPHYIFGALGANHYGMSLEGDVRNIQDMIIVGVRDEKEIRSFYARIDCCDVR